jgi:hypothetical protein
VTGLRIDATTVRESTWYRFAERYASWLDAADHPEIVASVFLVDEEQGALRLRRWNNSSHNFDCSSGPPISRCCGHGSSRSSLVFLSPEPSPRAPLPDDDSFVATPLVNAPPTPGEPRDREPGVFGFTIVQWDMDYVRTELLPTPGRSHFRNSDGDRYRIAVVDSEESVARAVSVDPDAPVDPGARRCE